MLKKVLREILGNYEGNKPVLIKFKEGCDGLFRTRRWLVKLTYFSMEVLLPCFPDTNPVMSLKEQLSLEDTNMLQCAEKNNREFLGLCGLVGWSFIPMYEEVAGLIPDQGALNLGYGFNPQWVRAHGQWIHVSFLT